MDDLSVYSCDIQNHLQHLGFIQKKNEKSRTYTQAKQIKFLKNGVAFLGHIVPAEGISIVPERLEAIQG